MAEKFTQEELAAAREEIKKYRREYGRIYREKNREHIREYSRAWRKKNPEKVQAAQERHWVKKVREARALEAEQEQGKRRAKK